MIPLLFTKQNMIPGIIVLFSWLALAALIFFFGKGRINRVLGCISAFFVAGVLFLAFGSLNMGTVQITTNGNPGETVRYYYDAILSENYEQAYGYLRDYESLGLEKNSDDELRQRLMNALKESYACELVGDTVVSDLTAVQRVRFSYLNIDRIMQNADAGMEKVLNDKVQSRPKKESFDEDNNYRPELLEEAYEESLEKAFAVAESYVETLEYDVELQYIDGSWYIVTNEEMMKGFSGGVF